MHRYRYLLVGGGIAADAAARAIRQQDSDAPIGLIGEEPYPPYDRPPLSKELWTHGAEDTIWRGTGELGVTLHLGRRAVRLDVRGKRLFDDRGTEYTFDSLLLATGGTPRRVRGGAPGVVYFRTLDDYRRLRALAEQGGRFVVLGGGFIGWELAAALRRDGRDVVMLFPEPGIGARLFPADLSQRLTEAYRARGVDVRPAELVSEVRAENGHFVLRTRAGRTLWADAVVAGLGIRPNVALARAAGLPVGDGIEIDEFLRTAHPDIYAAGDVASVLHPVLGRRVRVEHEDAANTTGWHAGRAMAGDAAPYRHLPYFYSDLFDDSFEAVGELDPRGATLVADWREPYREGAVYYLRAGRVRGVLLWNLPAKLTAARRLITTEAPVAPEELPGALTG